jgi:hypothetical protein
MQFGSPGVSNAPLVTETLSPTVSQTSGNTSIEGAEAVRYGNVVLFNFDFKFTGTTNAGSNCFVGSVSGLPSPALPAQGTGYFSNSALIAALDPDFTFTIRVIGGNRSSSNTKASIRLVYICN